ncbi:PQQ-dependent sugar dehydrogenase [Mangrovimonas sp. TPBH4]|uniref:PQQ-dependent sugar dehydrogenase n=1 Tax=Mangrovimonas sp. TPBH4 TaxID=1645914 RepID=UPI0009EB9B20|nr:PQQ-dependent sugar dehydrogenase [Mangrovimonas sp. TPBH4]
MRNFLTTLLVFCFYNAFSQDINIEAFATGLVNPVNIKHAGDDRLFVVEQEGTIQIINSEGVLNSSPFLDISSIVYDGASEQGLLGLAFHPNYASNGYFYVNYINNSQNTVISRFERSDINTADPDSELILLNITQPYNNHNGGDLAFGTDGYLYIATGDGGNFGDPEDRAQDLSTLLGKLLRIDVDTPSGANNYGIPSDNPFISNPNALDEIWAYGLRNPWKFSFDKDTDDLWIADVGQNLYEEINMVSPSVSADGLNYGWRCYEGNNAYNSTDCPDDSTLTFPVGVYAHSGNGGPTKCSITGGYRYRGNEQSALEGLYFFADFCSNEIGYLEPDANEWTMTFTSPYLNNEWSCFGEDVNGELYIAGLTSGTVYKITTNSLSTSESQIKDIKIYTNSHNNTITIDLINSASLNEINLYNIQGRFLKSITNFESSKITFSSESYASGVYLLELKKTNGSRSIKKIIVD